MQNALFWYYHTTGMGWLVALIFHLCSIQLQVFIRSFFHTGSPRAPQTKTKNTMRTSTVRCSLKRRIASEELRTRLASWKKSEVHLDKESSKSECDIESGGAGVELIQG